MSRNEFTTLVVLAVIAGGALLVLPVVVAILRDIEGKADVLLLVLVLGWTGVAWACALVLALTRPSRRQVKPDTERRPVPRYDRSGQPYHDGVYLISSGADSHTWAVHAAGVWRIVYEVGGVERLVGPVPETDVPLGVLAEALRPTGV